MTREESIKVLSILKAAYPNSYRGMGKEEANGVVMIWATQFSKISFEAVILAINNLIKKKPFPPSISDVFDELKEIHEDAHWSIFFEYAKKKTGSHVPENVLSNLKKIEELTAPVFCGDITNNTYLLEEKGDIKNDT